MAQTSKAIEHNDVAKGVAALPLGSSTGQWAGSLNFRMWKKRCETVKRKTPFMTLTPLTQSLDIPTTQACNIIVQNPVLPPPPIIECDPPVWPTTPIGLPYENNGTTLTGLTAIYGSLPTVVGGVWQFDYPINTDPSPGTGSYQYSAMSFPIVAGDFIAEFDFRSFDAPDFVDYGMGLIFYDNTNQGMVFGGGAFTVSTGGLASKVACDISQLIHNAGISSLPFIPSLPTGGLSEFFDGAWHTLKLTRSGSMFELFLDTVSFGVFDCESLVKGNLGFIIARRTWDSNTPVFNIRNVSIVSP